MDNIVYLIIGLVLGLVIMGIILLIVHNNDKKTAELLKESLPNTFKAVASDALRENDLEFQERAKQAQAPINSLVTELRNQIDATEKSRKEDYGGLMMSAKSLNEGTQKLLNMLNNNQARGGWGEVQLKRIIELAGMTKHYDYVPQNVTMNANEETIKPDIVITMPNNRQIIVDSKAPMTAYNNAIANPTDEDPKKLFAGHAKEVKEKIDELAKKNYPSGYNTPDFVVLFMPNDALLSAAQIANPNLLEYAMEQGVAIATPSTLFCLLMAVKMGWSENALTEHAQKIAELAEKLADDTDTWLGHIQKLGKSLNGAVDSYNSSIGSLDRFIINDINKMKEYGVNNVDSLKNLNIAPCEVSIRESKHFNLLDRPVDSTTENYE